MNGLATFETKTVAVSCQRHNIPNKIGSAKKSGEAGVKFSSQGKSFVELAKFKYLTQIPEYKKEHQTFH